LERILNIGTYFNLDEVVKNSELAKEIPIENQRIPTNGDSKLFNLRLDTRPSSKQYLSICTAFYTEISINIFTAGKVGNGKST